MTRGQLDFLVPKLTGNWGQLHLVQLEPMRYADALFLLVMAGWTMETFAACSAMQVLTDSLCRFSTFR